MNFDKALPEESGNNISLHHTRAQAKEAQGVMGSEDKTESSTDEDKTEVSSTEDVRVPGNAHHLVEAKLAREWAAVEDSQTTENSHHLVEMKAQIKTEPVAGFEMKGNPHHLVDTKMQMKTTRADENTCGDNADEHQEQTDNVHRLVETKTRLKANRGGAVQGPTNPEVRSQRSVRFEPETKSTGEGQGTGDTVALGEGGSLNDARKAAIDEVSFKWAHASVRGEFIPEESSSVTPSAVAIFVTEPVADVSYVKDEAVANCSTTNSTTGAKKKRNTIFLLLFFLGMIGIAIAGTLCGLGKCRNGIPSADGVALIVNATCGDGDRGNGVCPYPSDCCSDYGWCGEGAEYCAEGVALIVNATCGDGDRGNGVCPYPSDCCSDYGWCGEGAEYCFSDAESCGGGTVGDGKCLDETHCCSERGWCGEGPQYCFSTCGEGFVGDGSCAHENECCSSLGWCVAPDLCGEQ